MGTEVGSCLMKNQSWALALFFQVSSQFLSMDCYHSIAHFADFQVRSSLNRSQKDQWFNLGKKRKNAQLLLKLQWFALFKIPALPPPPNLCQLHMYVPIV